MEGILYIKFFIVFVILWPVINLKISYIILLK